MAQVIININYREYPISCESGEEVQIMKLGRLLDDKARELTKALGPINENLLLAMVGLLVADEVNDLKKELNTTKTQIETLKNTVVSTATSNSNETALENQEKNTTSITDEDLLSLDEEIATHINSLNELIKSVALKLKSV